MSVSFEESLNVYKNQHKMLGELIEKIESIMPMMKSVNLMKIDIPNLEKETSEEENSRARTATKPVRKIARSARKIVKVEKPMSLPALVEKIVTESKEPLTYSEVAEIAIKNGYKSSAKNFANNVYQSLNIHVRNKTLRQERVDGELKFTA